ncbi:MAG: hypothetical protein GT598_09895 [Bacteroidales bacterium]|nr:hypothetical protein [Bacteroidales bacterium]HPM18576.1 hypothetical protein [Bacteroidales bacterium]
MSLLNPGAIREKVVNSSLSEQNIFFFVTIAATFIVKMIKKTAASAFLILAGLLLLVQAAVPHHHHGKLVCFAKSHCINDEPTDDRGNSHPDHSNDGDCGSDNCMLKEPALISSNQPDSGFKFLNKNSCQDWNDNSPAGIPGSETDNQLSALLHSVIQTKISFPDPGLSFTSKGLRSPPAI